LPGLGFPDDRGIDDLFGPVDPEYIRALRVKWRIDETWQVGDDVPRPLDLPSFAHQLDMSPDRAKGLDEKMTGIFRDAIRRRPGELLPVEFAGQRIEEAEEWWWQNYGEG
jgi:hypothetical protein